MILCLCCLFVIQTTTKSTVHLSLYLCACEYRCSSSTCLLLMDLPVSPDSQTAYSSRESTVCACVCVLPAGPLQLQSLNNRSPSWGNHCCVLTLSAAKCCRRTQTHTSVSAEVNALSCHGETDRQRHRQPSRGVTYLQTDKQMAGKWVDGHKGKESSSQTDRKTDGKLIGRQTGGQNDKWDMASQTD